MPGCTQPKQNYVILCNGYKINSIKLSCATLVGSSLISSCFGMRHTCRLIGHHPLFQVWHTPHLLAHPSLAGCGASTPISVYLLTGLYLFLRLTFPIPVCMPGCTQPKQNYVILCNGYKINSIKLSCATLVGSSLISSCGMRHTCRLIHHPLFQVWHTPHLLAHPSLAGCGASTPISVYLLTGCYRHPLDLPGSNNLSPIYCQMVVTLLCTYVSVRGC